MPGALLSDDRRSPFDARRRRGVGGFRRHLNRASIRRRNDERRYGERGYPRRRHGAGGHRGPRRHHQNGAASLPAQALGPAAQLFAPVQVHVPAAPLVSTPTVADACPASVAPVEAVPPPGNDVIFLDDDEHEAAPLPSPTPVVVEVAASDALAYVSAPTGSTVFTFGSGVGSFSNAAAADCVAPPRLQSPTPAVEDDAVPPGYARMPSSIGRGSPATPPSSARAEVRRRLLTLGVPLARPPSSSRGNRASTRSPATLALASGVSNGVVSSHGLLGGSSSEEYDGARRRLAGRP